MSPLIAVEGAVQQITSDQALKAARMDAEKAYRDLTPYRILVEWHQDGWHVDYELVDQNVQGGGPHYVIDTATSDIRSKRYEQ